MLKPLHLVITSALLTNASGAEDIDTEQFLSSVQRESGYLAIARGLRERYDCTNYAPGEGATALSIESLDAEAAEVGDESSDYYHVNKLVVRATCEGGPEIIVEAGPVNGLIADFSHYITRITFEDQQIEHGLPNGEIDVHGFFRELVMQDPFITSIHPRTGASKSSLCVPIEEGVLRDFTDTNRFVPEVANRISFTLACRITPDNWPEVTFEGWYDTEDNAIDWIEIRMRPSDSYTTMR